jgi:hypothetical protein
LIAALSPYHLTTREAPALVASLLAEEVVTLLPTPESGATGARSIPEYVRFTQTWQWSLPLWKAGVLRPEIEGDRPSSHVQAVHEEIRAQDEYRCLRAFLVDDTAESEIHYLAAVASDLLKAGPNPGLSIPVAAAVDRFAGRHGAVVMRSVAASLAQHAETPLGTPVFSICMPLLVQADAARVLHARQVLDDALVPVRDALADLAASVVEGPPPRERVEELTHAAGAYAGIFEQRRAEVLDDAENDAVRPVDTHVALMGVIHPPDVVLRSSAAAAKAAGAAGGARGVRGDPSPRGLVRTGPPVLSLIVRPLGLRR